MSSARHLIIPKNKTNSEEWALDSRNDKIRHVLRDSQILTQNLEETIPNDWRVLILHSGMLKQQKACLKSALSSAKDSTLYIWWHQGGDSAANKKSQSVREQFQAELNPGFVLDCLKEFPILVYSEAASHVEGDLWSKVVIQIRNLTNFDNAISEKIQKGLCSLDEVAEVARKVFDGNSVNQLMQQSLDEAHIPTAHKANVLISDIDALKQQGSSIEDKLNELMKNLQAGGDASILKEIDALDNSKEQKKFEAVLSAHSAYLEAINELNKALQN